jgi:hypothetical protein
VQIFKQLAAVTFLGLASLGTAFGSAQATLILNGGFESPSVASASFSQFFSGSTGINNWTVFGPTGTDVAIVHTSFVSSPFSYVSQEGTQWLDLTGGTNFSAAGVSQSVATSIGRKYDLSYYVGNNSSTTSTVDVLLNDVLQTSSVNSTTGNSLDWEQFTFSFIATSASTKVSFRNGDLNLDGVNGLDNVVLKAVVPEPGALAIFGIGLAGLAGMRRRRKAA